MSEQPEEKMFDDFIACHYRRMLLTLDSKTDTHEMTDSEAEKELSALLPPATSVPNMKKLPPAYYKIISIAASFIVVTTLLVYYFFQSGGKKDVNVIPVVASTDSSSLPTDRAGVGPTFTDSAEKTSAVVLELPDTLNVPEYFSEKDEVFGFDGKTDKQSLNWESLVPLLQSRFPEYEFHLVKGLLHSKTMHAGNRDDRYSIRIGYGDGRIFISCRFTLSGQNEADARKAASRFSSSLRSYFREIAR